MTDRLVGVPNAVHDPLPVDFLVLPTHPVRYVEYRLAARWDQEVVHVPAVGGKTTAMPLWKLAEERREQEVRRRKRMATARAGAPTEAGDGPGVRPAVAANEHGHGRGHVSRELRDTAKHRPAVKRLVRVLEEPVRRFLMEQQRSEADHDDGPSSSSEEDDELVFVGRNGGMQDARSWKRAHREKKVQRTGPDGAGFQSARAEVGLVFDSPEDDESGAFKYAFLLTLCLV